MDVVQTILEPLIIRRTKDMKDEDGNAIIPLPSKTVTTQYLTLSPEEEDIYQSISRYSLSRLAKLQRRGKADYIH
ncbi:DNA helicase rad5, partial [Kappamyces sp. JEL0680]